ncbi:hypothetical protein LTR85_000395 [Meristemomyces frigidus]|nr:hypothetical protein LTR85_000395 [Meristemomyces frigidus]
MTKYTFRTLSSRSTPGFSKLHFPFPDNTRRDSTGKHLHVTIIISKAASEGHIYHAIAVVYGSVTLAYLSIWYFLEPDTWRPETEKRREELEKAKLVIFLHGFPDSAHIFSRLITSEALKQGGTKLVALDLPGYGGSDSSDSYGPDQVLNAVAEAIELLKRQYLRTDGEQRGACILVGHDWGGAISFRIAAETVPHAKANIQRVASKAQPHLSGWRRKPWEISLFKSAYAEIDPVVKQLLKSSYIFMFNLPFPLTALSLAVRQLLRLCHREISGGHSSDAMITATSNGPSEAECVFRSPAGGNYGSSVLRRARNGLPSAWLERIRLYREGLATGKWTPNDSTKQHIFKYGEATGGARKYGTFNYPMTIIFGTHDLAFDTRIVLDGIEDFFDPGTGDKAKVSAQSHVIRLPGQGHWLFTSKRGAQIVEQVLLFLLTGSDGNTAVQAATSHSLEKVLKQGSELGELTVAIHPQ